MRYTSKLMFLDAHESALFEDKKWYRVGQLSVQINIELKSAKCNYMSWRKKKPRPRRINTC